MTVDREKQILYAFNLINEAIVILCDVHKSELYDLKFIDSYDELHIHEFSLMENLDWIKQFIIYLKKYRNLKLYKKFDSLFYFYQDRFLDSLEDNYDC